MGKYQSHSEEVQGTTYRYDTEWIHELQPEMRWRLYWHQQRIMDKKIKAGDRVLEIGVGTKFTANYLRDKGVEVVTLDIDKGKNPDIHANVAEYAFPDVYDHILAFEVFEHMPYQVFLEALEKIKKVCNGFLFVAIPRNERVLFRVDLKIYKWIKINKEIYVKRGKVTEPNHHWEIDCGQTTSAKVEADCRSFGYEIIEKDKAHSDVFYVLKA